MEKSNGKYYNTADVEATLFLMNIYFEVIK